MGLHKILAKLKRLKNFLEKFQKMEIGDIPMMYNFAIERYIEAQSLLATNQKDSTLKTIEIDSKEKFLTTKRSVKKRKEKKRITTFILNGKIIDDYDSIIAHYFNHFKNIMLAKSSSSKKLNSNCLVHGNKLSLQQ
uniref:Uncharacterized protein n=1 Tax=Cannabis sativa TaxID=3483 RepID=A0A803NWW8_CANSA